MSKNMAGPLPDGDQPGRYRLIYADPPWTYRDKACSGKRGACFKYPVMTTDAICELPVSTIAAHNCLLAMWWTGALEDDAKRVVKAWGFDVVTMKGFTWVKQNPRTGKYSFGMGQFTRANTEDVLFARIGKPKRVDAGVSQLVVAPRMGHSVKPVEVADRLVRLMGDVPRIELFARDPQPGWDAWGFETPGYPFTLQGRDIFSMTERD